MGSVSSSRMDEGVSQSISESIGNGDEEIRDRVVFGTQKNVVITKKK